MLTVNTPWPLTVKVVCLPGIEGFKSTEEASKVPSTSESFVKIVIDTGVSSLVVPELLTAIGASFWGATVMVTVAVFETNESLSLTK